MSGQGNMEVAEGAPVPRVSVQGYGKDLGGWVPHYSTDSQTLSNLQGSAGDSYWGSQQDGGLELAQTAEERCLGKGSDGEVLAEQA